MKTPISILFFAGTGVLQLFSLHEAHDAYHPPALIEALGKVHKDQVFAVEKRETEEHAKTHHEHHEHPDDAPKATTYLLKWFFAAAAVGLIASTCLGLWMALVHGRERGLAWVLLIAGAAIPIALVAL